VREKGFTFIELIITMAISSVVGLLLLVIIVNSAGVFYKESSKLSEGLNINDAQNQIRESIKQTNSIAVSYTFAGVTYTSGLTQLVLKVPAIDSSNNLIANTYDYFIFYSDTNKLRFRTFPDAASARKSQDQIFSTNVDQLKFEYLNLLNPPQEVVPSAALKVRTTLILRQKSGANYETTAATSEANLRND